MRSVGTNNLPYRNPNKHRLKCRKEVLVHQPESPLIKPEEEEDVSRQTKHGGSNNNILFPLLQVAETLLQSSGEETENNKEVMPVRGNPDQVTQQERITPTTAQRRTQPP